MFKNLTAIIAGTLIALATGPAFAQSQNVPEGLDALINLLMPKTIFVTSDVYTGNLVMEANTRLGTSFSASEGLEAGDALCQDRADAPGSIVPEAEYVALLSADGVNAPERITPSSGPYIRSNGIYVTSNAAAIWDTANIGNPLISAVNRDETGGSAPVTSGVWTGSLAIGQDVGLSCMSWGAGEPPAEGISGNDSATDQGWLNSGADPCANVFHLYCVGL